MSQVPSALSLSLSFSLFLSLSLSLSLTHTHTHTHTDSHTPSRSLSGPSHATNVAVAYMSQVHFSIQEQLLCRNVERFRGGLVFMAHILVYYSTLGSRVTMKKKKTCPRCPVPSEERSSRNVLNTVLPEGHGQNLAWTACDVPGAPLSFGTAHPAAPVKPAKPNPQFGPLGWLVAHHTQPKSRVPKNNCFAELSRGSEEGSCLRLIDQL